MSDLTTLLGTPSATSSPASVSGVTRSAGPDGVTIDTSGQALRHASLSARRAKDLGLLTNDTYGLCISDLLEPEDLLLSLESKSPANLPSEPSLAKTDEMQCTNCGHAKPAFTFSKTGYKNTYRTVCKDCRNEAARQWGQIRRTSTSSRASRLISGAKARSMAKGLFFDLDTTWLQEKLDRGCCEATGIAFDMAVQRGWNTPSLDRLRPAEGYTKANTRLVIFALNAACGTWGENKVIEIAEAVLRQRRARSERLSNAITERLKIMTAPLGSSMYNLTWKERATPSGRRISALRASGRRTSDNASTSSAPKQGGV